MKAYLLVDRNGTRLKPLTTNSCVALLAVAGKTLLEHSMDALVMAGIEEITVISSEAADRVRDLLGNGVRWGASIQYMNSRGNCCPASYFRQHKIDADGCLVLRGDILRPPKIDEFISRSEEYSGTTWASLEGQAAGIVRIRGDKEIAEAALKLLRYDELVKSKSAGTEVDLGNGAISYVESFRDYHRVNIDAADGKYCDLLIPGRAVDEGMKVGRFSQVSAKNLVSGRAVIGTRCQLDRTVELDEGVVIGDDVVVDANATIRNSVVMAHTYVGQHLNVDQSIVKGNHLIRVDTNVVVRVNEEFMLANLETATLAESLAAPINRSLGVLALLVSIPLWPLAWLLSVLDKGERAERVWSSERLIGNRLKTGLRGESQRREFCTGRFATSVPVLRNLPRLLSVIAGDIRLIGASPPKAENESDPLEAWETAAMDTPYGLVSPVDIELPPSASSDEKMIFEGLYARQRTTARDFSLLVRAVVTMFSKRAWLPKARDTTMASA